MRTSAIAQLLLLQMLTTTHKKTEPCKSFTLSDAIDACGHMVQDHPCCAPALAGVQKWLEVANIPEGPDESLKTILAIDLKVAEVDFTLSVLEHLIKSLNTDIDRNTILEWVDQAFPTKEKQ